MPIFQYTALTPSGEQVSGEIDADSKDAALEYVQRQNLLTVEIKVESNTPWWFFRVEDIFSSPLSTQTLFLFTKQLGRLLKSGLELDRAIQLLIELAENKDWNHIIRRLNENIRRGKSLAESMSIDSRVFPNDYVSMIRAGESTGTLGSTLERLANLLQRRARITQRVLSALIYPAILLIMSVGSIIIILTVVMPQFEPFFVNVNVKMPLSTHIVITLSDFVIHYWWLGVGVLVAGVAFWKHVKRSPILLLSRDKLLLKMPLIGSLLLRADVTRLAQTLGTLIQNGITLGDGLSIAGRGVKNLYLRQAIETSVLAIREGEGLVGPFIKTGCFPKLMLNLIQIGEESGRLEEVLVEVADIYEDEMQQSIDAMLTLLVPFLIIGMGLIVAFLVAAMLMAMLSINDLAL